MYIPNHFRNKNQGAALAFMRQFNFATLVSVNNGKPIATHLPFVVIEDGDKIILSTHLAKNNPQVQDLNGEVLVIFQEPHAYISPSLYNHEMNVPTWNYVAVHCYGTSSILPEETHLSKMEEFIMAFEPSYIDQFKNLPLKYKEGLSKGVHVIEINVNELQAKEKLSQNKSAEERIRIAESLSKSDDSAARTLSSLMDHHIKGENNA